MEKDRDNRPAQGTANPVVRRNFIKAATLLGLGTLTAGSLKSYANPGKSQLKKAWVPYSLRSVHWAPGKTHC